MHPLSLPYLLVRPSAAVILDPNGMQWESWLAQIRTDAIISGVWQYIDPSIPDNQIPALIPPPPLPPVYHYHDHEDGAGTNNSSKAASDWVIAALANDRRREWRIYDEKVDALRIIRAFIFWTAPVQWMTFEGVVGGGPFGDVRTLLVFLSARVRAIRNQMASQQRQRAAAAAAGSGGGGGSSNTGVVAQGHYVFP